MLMGDLHIISLLISCTRQTQTTKKENLRGKEVERERIKEGKHDGGGENRGRADTRRRKSF